MIKKVSSDGYNYIFNYDTGFFARWGKTVDENPVWSPMGPEILDIEVSTICHGIGSPCKWCYKSNTPIGKNMSFETFKIIFDKMPKNLTQIAFGIGDIDANPDLFKMFEYCRKNEVVPNVTINGYLLTDGLVDRLVDLCGAVAVSNYNDDLCYGTVKRLADKGLKQVNIHQLFAKETTLKCLKTMEDAQLDSRLDKLNAIVFLTLKPKGKRNDLTVPGDVGLYKQLIDYAIEHKVRIGFDSCGANMFLEAVKGRDDYKSFEAVCEPCESGLFSSYINVDSKYFPCSFAEGLPEFGGGVDVVNCSNFIEDVWNKNGINKWRYKLLKNKRGCPIFNLEEGR